MSVQFDVVTGIWLFVFIASIIIEINTPNLTTIWFAAGAFVAMLFSLFTQIGPTVQLGIFIVVSFALIFTLRKWSRRLLKGNVNVKTNIDEVVGKEVIIIKEVNNFEYGECRHNGLVWTVKSQNGELLKKDEVVTVVEVEGNKLVVVKKEGK